MNARFDKVRCIENSQSSEWLFASQEYTEWQDKANEKPRTLMLRGKAGSGKSVLIKSAILRAKDNKSIPLNFFFSKTNETNKLDASAEGLYRSLLTQLVKASVVSDSLLEGLELEKAQLKSLDGLQHALKDALQSAVEHCTSNDRQIHIYLDAIDLCNQSSEDGIFQILQFFFGTSEKSLQETGTGIQFFLSSGYERNYAAYLTDAKFLKAEEGNKKDLESYIIYEIKNMGIPVASITILLQFLEDLKHYAAGSFMWVQLILQDIKEHWLNHPGMEVLNLVGKIPQKLSALYSELLEPSLLTKKNETLGLFQILCFAEEPLTMAQVRQAMAIYVTLDQSSKSAYELALEGLTQENFEELVRSISCGLVEFTNRPYRTKYARGTLSLSNPDTYATQPYAHFVNDSARAYLIENGLASLGNIEQTQVDSGHFVLLQIMLRVLEYDNLKADSTSPLRQYAGAYWMKHGGKCDELLKASAFKVPRFVTNCVKKTSRVVELYQEYLESGESAYSIHLRDEQNLFVCLAAEGCTELMKQHREKCKSVDCVGPSSSTHTPASTPGMEQEDRMEQVTRGTTMLELEDDSPTIWQRALNIASIADQTSTIKFLDPVGGHQTSAFYMACYNGNAAAVKSFLVCASDRKSLFGKCEQPDVTALHAATVCRNLKVLEAIFDTCNDEEREWLLSLTNNDGCTALHIATIWEYDDVVKLLIERIEDLDDTDKARKILDLKTNGGEYTALEFAQEEGMTNVVDIIEEFIENLD